MNEGIRIKVWALFRFYYPNFAGPAIQAPRTLAPLLDQGFDITVLAAAENEAAHLARQELNLYGMPTRYLPVIKRLSWDTFSKINILRKLLRFFNGLLSDLSLSLQFARTLRRSGKAGEVIQMYSSNTFSFLVTGVAKSRRMHTVIQTNLMGSDSPDTFRKDLLGKLRMRAYQDADVVIAISNALVRSCLAAGIPSEKVLFIPNGVDMNVFHPVSGQTRLQLKNKLHLSEERRYLIFVGAAIHRKGIDILIRAFIDLGHKIDDIDLLVVGQNEFGDHARHPPDRQRLIHELQNLLERNHMSSRVKCTGLIDNVHEYLQVAEIFCFPTRREGLPTVIAEAMATGLPVITSKLEGVTTDFVHSGVEGILIDHPDPGEYSLALENLLVNPDQAKSMGLAARMRVEREFSLQLAVEHYKDLYQSLSINKL